MSISEEGYESPTQVDPQRFTNGSVGSPFIFQNGVDSDSSTDSEDNEHQVQQEIPEPEVVIVVANDHDEDNWEVASKVELDPDDHYKATLPIEVEGMYSTLIIEGGKTTRATSLQNVFIKNMFTMVACYVMDEISTTADAMRFVSLRKLAEQRFDTMMKNLPKREYEKSAFFCYMPDNNWPDFFIAYVAELYQPVKNGKQSPGAKWAANETALKNLAIEDQMKYYVGHKIHEEYVTAKGLVNMHLYKAWKDNEKLPSGFALEALFRAVRKSLWRMEAYRRAKNSTKSSLKRTQQAAGGAAVVIDIAAEDEAVRDKATAVLGTLTYEWYPDYWLAFVMYSAPA